MSGQPRGGTVSSREASWTAEALAAANEQNLAEAIAALGHAPGVEVDTSAPRVRTATGIPHAGFNLVGHARLHSGEADQAIADTLAWFATRRVPIWWWIGPATTPDDLGPRLEGHGLTLTGSTVGMGRHLDTVPEAVPVPDGCTVMPVSDEAGLRGIAHTTVAGNALPAELLPAVTQLITGLGSGRSPWRFYLAREHEAAVATAALFLGSEVAGIYLVATVPDARRRGFGAAVTAAALQEAQALGYRTAVLHASKMGEPVYRRLGFEAHCTFQSYRWVPPEA